MNIETSVGIPTSSTLVKPLPTFEQLLAEVSESIDNNEAKWQERYKNMAFHVLSQVIDTSRLDSMEISVLGAGLKEHFEDPSVVFQESINSGGIRHQRKLNFFSSGKIRAIAVDKLQLPGNSENYETLQREVNIGVYEVDGVWRAEKNRVGLPVATWIRTSSLRNSVKSLFECNVLHLRADDEEFGAYMLEGKVRGDRTRRTMNLNSALHPESRFWETDRAAFAVRSFGVGKKELQNFDTDKLPKLIEYALNPSPVQLEDSLIRT